MTDKHVLDADAAFFAALLAADSTALDGLLAADFLLVDVLAGQVVARDMFLDLVGSRRLEFVEVLTDPGQASVRERPGLGVVLGRTRMTMRFEPFAIRDACTEVRPPYQTMSSLPAARPSTVAG